MVIVTGMIRELVSTSGPLNQLIAYFGGEKISFIAYPKYFNPIFVISGLVLSSLTFVLSASPQCPNKSHALIYKS